MNIYIYRYMLGAAVSTSLALGSSAMAQQGTASGQPGTTSGPASGRGVEPSTATQKQNPSAQTTGGEPAQGASARPGTQGGPSPMSSTSESTRPPTAEAAQGAVGAGAPGVSAKPGTEGGPSPETRSK